MLGKIDVAHPRAAEEMVQGCNDDPSGVILGTDRLRLGLTLAHRMLR